MLFEDEASFYRQPSVAPLFAPKGRIQPRCHYSHRSNSAVRAAVVLDAVGGRTAHEMRSHFTAAAVASFVKKVSAWADWAEQIFWVMDNWPVHSHEKVDKAMAADPRMRTLWLPTYAPWLNPSEKVWKWVRQKRCHMHTLSGSLPELRKLIDLTLDDAAAHPEDIRVYTGTGNDKLYGT
jgi:hypothetical protein